MLFGTLNQIPIHYSGTMLLLIIAEKGTYHNQWEPKTDKPPDPWWTSPSGRRCGKRPANHSTQVIVVGGLAQPMPPLACALTSRNSTSHTAFMHTAVQSVPETLPQISRRLQGNFHLPFLRHSNTFTRYNCRGRSSTFGKWLSIFFL